MSRTPVTKPYSMKSAGWYLQSCQPFRKGGIWYDCKLHRADGTEVKLFVRSRCTNKKSNTRATRQFRSSLQFHFGARGTYLFHRVVAFNCCNPRGLPFRSYNHVHHLRGTPPWKNSRVANMVVLHSSEH
jgi:hypothetical protein